MDSSTGVAAATAPVISTAEAQHPRWSAATRVAFRFVFCYFVLYMLPFPAAAQWLHLPRKQSGPNFIERWYDNAGHTIVPWAGKHLLHLPKDITVFSNGSGDTTYNWVAALCFLVVAAVATAIWSLLDRKRANYERLHAWFRIGLRLWLAGIIALYGIYKLYPSQFPAPYLARYFERYGDSSPMGILWTMMGTSRGYAFFTGAVETLGAVLLIIPRVATLGALVSAAAMTNVFLMNMTYDVPVKLFSLHLLLAAIVVAALDVPRLWNLFVRGRDARLSPDSPNLPGLRSKHVLVGAQLAIGAYILFYLSIGAYRQAKASAELPQTTPNYGAWAVDEFTLDGTLRPALTTDTERWQDFIIQGPGSAVIVPMDGSLDRCQAKLDDAKHTLEITSTQPKWSAKLSYARQADTMTLEGTRDGKPLKATMHRIDPQWLLKTRGFHWVNEFPFNR